MPVGNRLTGMLYDEVSVVDAGACNDDEEGAHVLLAKREEPITDEEIADFSKAYSAAGSSTSTKTSSKKSSSSKKKGNTQRAANWDEARHPRIKSGPGGGEFSSTSAASKKKYGKGGTAIDNLPAGDKTTNSTAAKLGLEHGITRSQAQGLKSVASSKGGSGPNKSGKGKKSGAKKAKSAQQKKLRQQVSLVNGLAANQRAAMRASNKPIPAGYQWNSNNRLVNSANVTARNKLASSLGLPAAQVSSKKKTASSAKSSVTAAAPKKTVTSLVMDRSGHIHRVTTTVKQPKPATKPAAKKTAAKKTRPTGKNKKRGAVKKINSSLNTWLYGERSAAS